HIVSDDPHARALPLAWSQRGWGLHVNALGRVQHRIDSEPEEPGYFIEVAERRLDVFFYLGEPAEVLSQYSQLTGRAGQPPLWSLGPWLRQAPDASVEQLAASAAELRQAGFPIDAAAVDGPAA